jgi:hypothetical protein
VVVVVIDGVVNGEPVPSTVPPTAMSYHVNVPPAHPVAVRSTVPVKQREFGPPGGASGVGLTVTV